MNILIYTFPFRGHTMQAIKIGNHLVGQGHNVEIDAHPSYFSYLLDKVIKYNCFYNHLQPKEKIDKDTLLNYAEGILSTSEKYVKQFKKLGKKPDFIIFDSMAYWGKLIAKNYKIKSLSLLTIQPFTHQNFIDFSYDYLKTYTMAYKNRPSFLRSIHIYQEFVKKKYGLPVDFKFDDLICATGDKNVVLMPKGLCKFLKDLDSTYEVFSPIMEIEKNEGNIKKGVYIATGSMITDYKFLVACINEIRDLKIDIYVSAGKFFKEIKREYCKFKNIYVYEFAPQMEILQKCALFITHGGTNSICEAIYFETPMIVIPFINDEFLNAEMVEACGIGLKINNNLGEISTKIKMYSKKILSEKIFYSNLHKINQEIDCEKALKSIDKLIKKLSRINFN